MMEKQVAVIESRQKGMKENSEKERMKTYMPHFYDSKPTAGISHKNVDSSGESDFFYFKIILKSF